MRGEALSSRGSPLESKAKSPAASEMKTLPGKTSRASERSTLENPPAQRA